MKIIQTENGIVVQNEYGYLIKIKNLHAKGLKVTQHNLEPTVDDQVKRILADNSISNTRIRAIRLLTVACNMTLRSAKAYVNNIKGKTNDLGIFSKNSN